LAFYAFYRLFFIFDDTVRLVLTVAIMEYHTTELAMWSWKWWLAHILVRSLCQICFLLISLAING
ncbi:hypothetical protein BX070DRAFT_227196, partial [Coemansia spiralis]